MAGVPKPALADASTQPVSRKVVIAIAVAAPGAVAVADAWALKAKDVPSRRCL